MVYFIIGLFIGFPLGFMTAGLMNAASRNDYEQKEVENE